MQLGIFAKTFVRSCLEDTFDAAKANGLDCIQFNFSCVGLPTLPEAIEPALLPRISFELERRSLFMAAVSGTCNLIHPDPTQRARDVRRLEPLIRAARGLRTRVVTLCTGTRDPANMWRAHPDNTSSAAWADLRTSLEALLPLAQEQGIFLGIEPEPANVIDSAPKARRLLDEMRSSALKIVLDAANLLQPHRLLEQTRLLSEAFDLLGPNIVLAHAKDSCITAGDGSQSGANAPPSASVAFTTCAAGRGVVDYDLYLSLLAKAGFDGPMILHSLNEQEVPAAVAFLNQHFRRLHHRLIATNAIVPPRQS